MQGESVPIQREREEIQVLWGKPDEIEIMPLDLTFLEFHLARSGWPGCPRSNKDFFHGDFSCSIPGLGGQRTWLGEFSVVIARAQNCIKVYKDQYARIARCVWLVAAAPELAENTVAYFLFPYLITKQSVSPRVSA